MLKIPDLESLVKDFESRLQVEEPMVEVESVFKELWSTTDLCFEGPGLREITKAYTVVLVELKTLTYGVYVDGRLANIIEKPERVFFDDLKAHNMQAIRKGVYTTF